jgi:hypothetical protein
MRLSLYGTDPLRQADLVPAEPAAAASLGPLSSAQLSASDRQALYSWAARHGFALRNAADEWLAEVAWRRDLESNA